MAVVHQCASSDDILVANLPCFQAMIRSCFDHGDDIPLCLSRIFDQKSRKLGRLQVPNLQVRCSTFSLRDSLALVYSLTESGDAFPRRIVARFPPAPAEGEPIPTAPSHQHPSRPRPWTQRIAADYPLVPGSKLVSRCSQSCHSTLNILLHSFCGTCSGLAQMIAAIGLTQLGRGRPLTGKTHCTGKMSNLLSA
jgi:hypothetical protein